MNHIAKAFLFALPLSLPLFEVSAASSSNTPLLINTDGCKIVITVPTSVCTHETFTANAKITLEYGSAHSANYPVSISGGQGATVTPAYILKCPDDVALTCYSGTAETNNLKITVGGVKSYAINVIDYSRRGEYPNVFPIGGPITARVTSEAKKYNDAKYGSQTVEMGAGYSSFDDACKAKYRVRAQIKFTGKVRAFTSPGGFFNTEDASAGAWARGQDESGITAEKAVHVSTLTEDSPLAIPLPLSMSFTLPQTNGASANEGLNGIGNIAVNDLTHEPNTPINYTEPVTVQVGGVAEAVGDAIAMFSAEITVEQMPDQEDLIVFSSVH